MTRSAASETTTPLVESSILDELALEIVTQNDTRSRAHTPSVTVPNFRPQAQMQSW
jgi:hypothetical protein